MQAELWGVLSVLARRGSQRGAGPRSELWRVEGVPGPLALHLAWPSRLCGCFRVCSIMKCAHVLAPAASLLHLPTPTLPSLSLLRIPGDAGSPAGFLPQRAAPRCPKSHRPEVQCPPGESMASQTSAAEWAPGRTPLPQPPFPRCLKMTSSRAGFPARRHLPLTPLSPNNLSKKKKLFANLRSCRRWQDSASQFLGCGAGVLVSGETFGLRGQWVARAEGRVHLSALPLARMWGRSVQGLQGHRCQGWSSGPRRAPGQPMSFENRV